MVGEEHADLVSVEDHVLSRSPAHRRAETVGVGVVRERQMAVVLSSGLEQPVESAGLLGIRERDGREIGIGLGLLGHGMEAGKSPTPHRLEEDPLAAAVEQPHAQPGMVAVIQTFGSSLKWNPHIHALVTRGVFLDDGTWHPIPCVDSHNAELLFRHKVLGLLRDREHITQERIELLLSPLENRLG